MPKKRKDVHFKKPALWFTIIIAFAVVSFWRGVWGLMDEFLFPNDYLISSIVSVVIGIVILVITKYARRELI